MSFSGYYDDNTPGSDPEGPRCPRCGDPMVYGELPTIQGGEIGHRVTWTCLNEKCGRWPSSEDKNDG